jgi:2-C-methyl-D-erythritol 4-phosphate cytidylyltransferase/2-C-methyl-D-erythritol 2,4-cyclodiphosphate synthase
VVPALEVTDTIKMVDEQQHVTQTLVRESLRAVQTPQGFSRELIVRAHVEAARHDRNGTDDASLVEAIGGVVLLIPGDERARKITTRADLKFHRLMKRKGARL